MFFIGLEGMGAGIFYMDIDKAAAGEETRIIV